MSGAGRIFVPDLLEGRAALVTGGGSGIGRGIAGSLLAHGADVCIASRDLEKLEAAASELEAEHGGRVLPLRTDVREPDRVEETVGRAAAELGGLDVLVNNAAGNFYCASEELSRGGWEAVVETDLHGTFYCSRAAFPHLKAAGEARIVNVSMTLHYRGWPKMAHATAAKAGVDALTRTLALEWAEHGIRVNAVAPGPVPTEGVREAFRAPDGEEKEAADGSDGGGSGEPAGDEGAEASPGGRHSPAFADRAVPLGRLGTPDDVGRMVTYLCSPGGDWITGAVMVVDGGEWLQKVGMAPPGAPDG